MRPAMLPRLLTLLVASAALAGCAASTPQYTAVRTDPGESTTAATVNVSPQVRLLSLDGEPLDELPVVGVRDVRQNEGTHERRIVLSPGKYTLEAGIGPFFMGNSRTTHSAPMAPPGPGTHVSAGFGGGRTTSSIARYPGSELDQRVEFEVAEGGRYEVRIVGDAAEGSPGWRVEVFDQKARKPVSRVLEVQPSPHKGEPLGRYFKLNDGVPLP